MMNSIELIHQHLKNTIVLMVESLKLNIDLQKESKASKANR